MEGGEGEDEPVDVSTADYALARRGPVQMRCDAMRCGGGLRGGDGDGEAFVWRVFAALE